MSTKFYPMPAVVRWRRVGFGYNSEGSIKPLDWTEWHKVTGHDGALYCSASIPEARSMIFMPAYDYGGVPTCQSCQADGGE